MACASGKRRFGTSLTALSVPRHIAASTTSSVYSHLAVPRRLRPSNLRLKLSGRGGHIGRMPHSCPNTRATGATCGNPRVPRTPVVIADRCRWLQRVTGFTDLENRCQNTRPPSSKMESPLGHHPSPNQGRSRAVRTTSISCADAVMARLDPWWQVPPHRDHRGQGQHEPRWRRHAAGARVRRDAGHPFRVLVERRRLRVPRPHRTNAGGRT